ncbi:hypothetical protein ANCCAN_14334 [Ancylostoma caninum]|uniref:Uncharacterized protein n=1 Tax=Ancylostoma caninum TaxID=29170 RepID=A0A368G9M7_ANCCA|nr:hypothetical protein ANCCAN_14334 [Ancylostoma caninum]
MVLVKSQCDAKKVPVSSLRKCKPVPRSAHTQVVSWKLLPSGACLERERLVIDRNGKLLFEKIMQNKCSCRRLVRTHKSTTSAEFALFF